MTDCTMLTASARKRKLGALRLVREDSFDAPHGYQAGVRCQQPSAVFTFMHHYALREETEVLWMLALTAQHRVIWNRPLTVTRGILNTTLVHPQEVLRLAIHVNAAASFAVHNHPSGETSPSAEDRTVTEQLVAAGRLLDIPLLDLVIIGGAAYMSFGETGLM